MTPTLPAVSESPEGQLYKQTSILKKTAAGIESELHNTFNEMKNHMTNHGFLSYRTYQLHEKIEACYQTIKD